MHKRTFSNKQKWGRGRRKNDTAHEIDVMENVERMKSLL